MHDTTMLFRHAQFKRIIKSAKEGNRDAINFLFAYLEVRKIQMSDDDVIKECEEIYTTFLTNLNTISSSN